MYIRRFCRKSCANESKNKFLINLDEGLLQIRGGGRMVTRKLEERCARSSPLGVDDWYRRVASNSRDLIVEVQLDIYIALSRTTT
jgi:hypothetical protein